MIVLWLLPVFPRRRCGAVVATTQVPLALGAMVFVAALVRTGQELAAATVAALLLMNAGLPRRSRVCPPEAV
ncbi:hypothetical protein [Amycolatopsis anabasis]|uniref:hypothetical protein n=1 Tax=Amycolatopsis anabasis TaxID=1840409 RepID=UPI00131CBDC4|nr:hypothetical protein [Amycolatopsis anabasis]